ncbi:MAG: DUF3105 domain-containing protein [Alphaproteobacteria bacterium]|nr:DUF3105 domain-containing protein [Alphaproteobacteria bacterium]
MRSLLLLLLGCKGGPTAEECLTCTCTEEAQPSFGANHVTDPVDYADPPPTSGPHNPCWLEPGVYTEEPPDERWVHTMEHGAVVYLYNCPDGCADEVAQLEALHQEDTQRTLVAPYSLMTSRFAAVAWQNRLLADCLEAERFRQFHNEHVDNAPESTTAPPPEGCHDADDTGATDDTGGGDDSGGGDSGGGDSAR